MKSIMISIRPKWVAKILNGEKTVEIRKKFPSDYVGWVYIYCTKQNDLFKSYIRMGFSTTRSTADDLEYNGKGKVVARFWCDKVEELKFGDKAVQEKSCLTEDELFDYLFIDVPYNEDMRKGCGIYITKLEIFDKPKEISEFKHLLKGNKHDHSIDAINIVGGIPLTKAPMSWCWVEEREDI